MAADDDELLLAVLNTTPVKAGVRMDALQGDDGLAWLVAHGGTGSAQERAALVEARDQLQQAVRNVPDTDALARFLDGVLAVPVLEGQGLTWVRRTPVERDLAARVVLAWAELRQERPERLRACANPQCERFLIDRSRSNQARWCSMAICGNRAKARRHYERVRTGDRTRRVNPAPAEPRPGVTPSGPERPEDAIPTGESRI